jgi:site-specific recombinase XerD
MKNQLHQLGTSIETKNNFVFKKLKEEDFDTSIDLENFSIVSEHLYDKISKTGIVYNRDLKRLQKTLDFNKTLKSHLPRTTFTNIMMKGKVSHRDISNTLGHSSISITDEYIKSGFNNDGVDSVIKGTSDSFRKN